MCFSTVREVKVNLDYFFKRRSETRKYRRQGKQLKSELLELRKDIGHEKHHCEIPQKQQKSRTDTAKNTGTARKF